MRQFKFKEWVFKNLFPYYYQENDTYHDSSGKGILQRFIEVCSQYFDDDIIADNGTQPGLDNIVNLIDVDLTPELFLNYLWEFLGEIPYAYGLIIQGKEYDKDHLRDWLFNNTDFPQADPRKLLKYAISLYKIRGTDKFYRVLGHFYGFEIELVETTDGGNVGDDNLIPSHDHLVLATYPFADYTNDIILNKVAGTTNGLIINSNGWAVAPDVVLYHNKNLVFKENRVGYKIYFIICYDSNGDFLGYLVPNSNSVSTEVIFSQYPTVHHVALDLLNRSYSPHPALTEDDVNDWDLIQTNGEDDSIATYSLSDGEVRSPYPDGDCYSCLYFLVKVGISQERYNQLISQGRLATVMNLLLGIIEKYLPIHCKIAHYDNGNPKVIVYPGYDFTQDFNDDFAIENEE